MRIKPTLLTTFAISALAATVASKVANAEQVFTKNTPAPIATHGVAVGDVSSDSAVIWSRANTEAVMHVELHGKSSEQRMQKQVRVSATNDFTGKLMLSGLKADTDYAYRVWFSADEHDGGRRQGVEGRFHTAPRAQQASAVSFAWAGDVAGQNTCRDLNEGFPAFKAINAMQLDFFIGLGDMIYADGTCEATGRYGNIQVAGTFLPAFDMSNYWAHWKYNREDSSYQSLLARVPYYAIWDDHEVVNDFGPLHDTRDYAPYTAGEHLLPKGLKAFLNYNPVAENAATPKRLYRSVKWGKNMEMFILDTRQYRDANFAADDARQTKTMLGREQLAWLKDALQKSQATWKVIASSVPMSIPTGSAGEAGRDGWANYQEAGGFEHELSDILRFMQGEGMHNVMFLTTDVHFAEVFRYTPFADAPDFQVYEFVTGPVNAGVFPNRAFDDSLNPERLFFFGANSSDDVTTWEQAKGWFNYGAIRIDETGELTASIKDVTGKSVFEMELQPK